MNLRFRFGLYGLSIRLFFFLLLSAGLGIFLMKNLWLESIPVFLLLIISFANIIYHVDGVNRKLTYFFDAVRNEDLTLHFPENMSTPSLEALHKSMNGINSLISEVMIKHEHREKFFKGMLSSSATGIIAVDETGYIEIINPAALRLSGLSHIAHINLLKQKNNALYDVLEQIQPGQVQTLKMLDGQELKHLSIKVSHLKYRKKSYRVYSIYDIKAELEENELDSWQKLIRVLTHEIMNSIAPITSMSNSLHSVFIKKGKAVKPQDIDKQIIHQTLQGLEVIEQQGKGLINFVEAYRKLTKVPKPVFKPINIDNFFSRILLLIQTKLDEENIQLEIIRKNAGKDLVADEKLLSHVMINLLNNSIEGLRSINNKVIRITITNNANGRLVISISDNGIGIPAENLEKVFVPFFTTRENGSGIGLSLSRQIMRLHKGSISVQSTPGNETTFSLVF